MGANLWRIRRIYMDRQKFSRSSAFENFTHYIGYRLWPELEFFADELLRGAYGKSQHGLFPSLRELVELLRCCQQFLIPLRQAANAPFLLGALAYPFALLLCIFDDLPGFLMSLADYVLSFARGLVCVSLQNFR